MQSDQTLQSGGMKEASIHSRLVNGKKKKGGEKKFVPVCEVIIFISDNFQCSNVHLVLLLGLVLQ